MILLFHIFAAPQHGYAVTVYKSQGDTVDKTYFLLSEKTSQEGAYVAMSRHRNNAKIYLDRSCFSEFMALVQTLNFE